MKRKPATRAPASPEEVSAALRNMRAEIQTRDAGYRERSLKLHGAICGRCGREFPEGKRHLLTVHHKDGNAANNPPEKPLRRLPRRRTQPRIARGLRRGTLPGQRGEGKRGKGPGARELRRPLREGGGEGQDVVDGG